MWSDPILQRFLQNNGGCGEEMKVDKEKLMERVGMVGVVGLSLDVSFCLQDK